MAASNDKLMSVPTIDNVEKLLSETMLGIWQDFIKHLPFLAGGILILVLTALISSVVINITSRILDKSKVRRSLKDVILRLASIAVWLLGSLLAAMVVFPGLTPSKALGGLGIASLAVGFAFKDVFENFFAGILLLWRFPMEPGDYIECEGITGRIENITVRMTTIRKVSGEMIVVPNSFLFKNPLTILTNMPKVRTGIQVGIAYGEDTEVAVGIIEGAVNKCETVSSDNPPQVFPEGFGSSSVDIEVVWWTDPDPVNVRRSRGEVITAIKKSLDENNIEIPFPYRMLTFKTPLPGLESGFQPAGSE